MTGENKTALVTGASSGIGYELAKHFAENQFHLVLVSRDEPKLVEVGKDLNNKYGVGVTVIAKDLSKYGAAGEVYDEVQKQGIQVDVLVNNAGFGETGFFADTDLGKELEIIQVNITTVVHLTKLFLKDMVKRNDGKILQVASVASLLPLPFQAVYSASKAFVLTFTEALIEELKDTKVTMTALLPGATDTQFFERANAEDTKLGQSSKSEPEEVAKEAFDALMKGERKVIVGFKNKAMAAISNVVPDAALAAMARRETEKKE